MKYQSTQVLKSNFKLKQFDCIVLKDNINYFPQFNAMVWYSKSEYCASGLYVNMYMWFPTHIAGIADSAVPPPPLTPRHVTDS